MKPVLMVHEVDERLFDLPLEQYILTFDDGLFTQYKYIDQLLEIPTTKVFYITTGTICTHTNYQSQRFITCTEAHEKYFNTGVTEDYMTWNQIRNLSSLQGCYIGAHSHSHKNYRHDNLPVSHIIDDVKIMKRSFMDNLGYIPEEFCFPYNYMPAVYSRYIQHKGFKTTYSTNRVDVNDLLLEKALQDAGVSNVNYTWTCT